jgi:hypothetical protein
MTMWVVIGCVVGSGVLAMAWVDRRDRRKHGGRVRALAPAAMVSEAVDSRLDLQSLHAHTLQGSAMEWSTMDKRDRERRAAKQARGQH